MYANDDSGLDATYADLNGEATIGQQKLIAIYQAAARRYALGPQGPAVLQMLNLLEGFE